MNVLEQFMQELLALCERYQATIACEDAYCSIEITVNGQTIYTKIDQGKAAPYRTDDD